MAFTGRKYGALVLNALMEKVCDTDKIRHQPAKPVIELPLSPETNEGERAVTAGASLVQRHRDGSVYAVVAQLAPDRGLPGVEAPAWREVAPVDWRKIAAQCLTYRVYSVAFAVLAVVSPPGGRAFVESEPLGLGHQPAAAYAVSIEN